MKKTTLTLATSFAFLFTPLAANAALDFTPDTSKSLSDIFYMPEAGMFYSGTNYSYTTQRYDYVTYSAGESVITKNSDIKEINSSIKETIAYGLMDNLAVDLGLEYVLNNNRTYNDFDTAGKTRYRKDGLKNPIVGVTYRAMENCKNGMILDLRASYAPDLIDREESDSYYAHNGSTDGDSRRGNVASGNDVTTLGLKTGQRFKSMSWDVFGDVIFGTRTKANKIADGSSIEIAPTTDYKVGFDTQTRFTDMISLNAGLSYLFNEERDTTFYNSTYSSAKYDSGNETALDLALNFNLVPGTLALSANYQYKMIEDTDILYVGNYTSYDGYENNTAQTVGVTVHAQF